MFACNYRVSAGRYQLSVTSLPLFLLTQHNTFQSSPTPSDSALSSHLQLIVLSLSVPLAVSTSLLSLSLSLPLKPKSDLCRIQTAFTLMFCVNVYCPRFPCLGSYWGDCNCWPGVSDMSGCDRPLVTSIFHSFLKTVSSVWFDHPNFVIVWIFAVLLASAHSIFAVLSSLHSSSSKADVRHHQCCFKGDVTNREKLTICGIGIISYIIYISKIFEQPVFKI